MNEILDQPYAYKMNVKTHRSPYSNRAFLKNIKRSFVDIQKKRQSFDQFEYPKSRDQSTANIIITSGIIFAETRLDPAVHAGGQEKPGQLGAGTAAGLHRLLATVLALECGLVGQRGSAACSGGGQAEEKGGEEEAERSSAAEPLGWNRLHGDNIICGRLGEEGIIGGREGAAKETS